MFVSDNDPGGFGRRPDTSKMDEFATMLPFSVFVGCSKWHIDATPRLPIGDAGQQLDTLFDAFAESKTART
jgi:hypothetical protein